MADLDSARGRSRLLSSTASVAQEPARPFLNIQRKKPRPKRFRGMPPPLMFDLDALPASTLLTETETAAALRRSKSVLEVWRKQQPDHPLRWRRVGGRVLYELPSIRAFRKGAPRADSAQIEA
jgi:hypothetical protein